MRTPRLARALLVALLSITTALVAGPSIAAGQSGGGGRSQELQNQINEVSAAQAAALTKLADIQTRKAAIDAQVVALDQQVAAAEANLAPLDAEAARLNQEYVAIQAKVTETQAKLDAAQAELDASAAGLYRSARRGEAYGTVLAAKPDSLVQQDKYLEQVSGKRRSVVQRVTVLRDDLEHQRKGVETQKAKADAAAAAAKAERDRIASLRAQVEPARAEAADEAAAEQAALGDLQSQKSQAEAELASLQAASDNIAARIRAHGSAPGSPGPCSSRPVPGGIGSGFGMRYHPILHTYRMHSGADMHASEGEPIHACRSGDIIIAEGCGGYGNCVVMDNGGWMATLYAHQSKINVTVGQHVNAGDIIGYVGHTGLATGPHLHFEVRLSGNPVDPAPYLP
jgi:murein DD-endopeptidase MepM/ murein hydrolase activator NlpD